MKKVQIIFESRDNDCLLAMKLIQHEYDTTPIRRYRKISKFKIPYG